MKSCFVALVMLGVAILASAENERVDGGLSPDGRFEARIMRDLNREPSDYAIYLSAFHTKKPFYNLKDIGGLDRYAAAKQSCRALWHSSSRFVVITDRGTRHSQEIQILDVTSDQVVSLKLPSYVQNALGRVNATETDLHCITTPKTWKSDDLLLTLYFSTSTPAQGRRFYTCDVTLHINHGQNESSHVGLSGVTQPKENES